MVHVRQFHPLEHERVQIGKFNPLKREKMTPANQFLSRRGLQASCSKGSEMRVEGYYEFSSEIEYAYIVMSDKRSALCAKIPFGTPIIFFGSDLGSPLLPNYPVSSLLPDKNSAVLNQGLDGILVDSSDINPIILAFGVPVEFLDKRSLNRFISLGDNKVRQKTGLPLEVEQTFIRKAAQISIEEDGHKIIFAQGEMIFRFRTDLIKTIGGISLQAGSELVEISAEYGVLLMLEPGQKILLDISGNGSIFRATFYDQR